MSVQSAARTLLIAELAEIEDPSWFDGAVWDRELGYPGTDRETPGAFADGYMKTNVVILDPTESAHPQAFEVPDAALAELIFWYFAPDTTEGRSNIDELRQIVYELFADSGIELDGGRVGFPIWAGDMGTRENHAQFRDSVTGNTTFRVHYVRR